MNVKTRLYVGNKDEIRNRCVLCTMTYRGSFIAAKILNRSNRLFVISHKWRSIQFIKMHRRGKGIEEYNAYHQQCYWTLGIVDHLLVANYSYSCTARKIRSSEAKDNKVLEYVLDTALMIRRVLARKSTTIVASPTLKERRQRRDKGEPCSLFLFPPIISTFAPESFLPCSESQACSPYP